MDAVRALLHQLQCALSAASPEAQRAANEWLDVFAATNECVHGVLRCRGSHGVALPAQIVGTSCVGDF